MNVRFLEVLISTINPHSHQIYLMVRCGYSQHSSIHTPTLLEYVTVNNEST